MTQHHVIFIEPNTKPRMTRSDKWKKRPCVMRYRHFADNLRTQFAQKGIPTDFDSIEIEFHFAMPSTWSKKNKLEMDQKPHQNKPDIDNLCKAVFDSLMDDDSGVYQLTASKWWTAGTSRIEIYL